MSKARSIVTQVYQQLQSTSGGRNFSCQQTNAECLPQKDQLRQIVREISFFVFPDYYPKHQHLDDLERLENLVTVLGQQIHCGLCFYCRSKQKLDGERPKQCKERAQSIAISFIEHLPTLRKDLMADAEACFLGDPAATSIDEVIFTYPGLVAMLHHRIAHFLYQNQVPIIPRFISEICHSKTGIDIHPGATISPGLFIDHGTGIVIGETAVIGNGVKIYQGVTLGAKSFPLDDQGNPIKGIARHPILKDRVTIYAGATILGRITLGEGAVIGGNLWVTDDVPAGVMLSQKYKEA